MSASIRPTLKPIFERATATFTLVVDLPTPPFPEPIAMMCFTPLRGLPGVLPVGFCVGGVLGAVSVIGGRA